MKIGYFITHFPYDRYHPQYYCGGMEVAAANLVAGMLQRGHEVSVFTTSLNHRDSLEKRHNLTIHRYGRNFRIGQTNLSFRLLYKPLKEEVDIVHAHAGVPPAPIAALRYAKKREKPLVVTYHGDAQENWGDVLRRTSVFVYNKFLLHQVLSSAKVIISPSRRFIDDSAFLKKYKHKTIVIPNGLILEDFEVPYSKEECRQRLGLPNEANLILYVGALSPDKGPDILLEAMLQVVKQLPGARLIILGEGPLRRKLERRTQEFGLNGKVEFKGFIADPFKKALFYKSSDIFVLPSAQEIFGLVLLEAMACSVPVVASQVGGIPDLIEDGENGLLVPPRNSNELAKAIVRLLQDTELRARIVGEGQKRVRSFSWHKIAEQTERIYEEAIR